MQDPGEPRTLAGVMDALTQQGFPEHFAVTNGLLRGIETRRSFGPDEVRIAEYYRFEGVSDPDDMSILYAIRTRTGAAGTLADAFGVYSDPLVSGYFEGVAFTPSCSRRQ